MFWHSFFSACFLPSYSQKKKIRFANGGGSVFAQNGRKMQHQQQHQQKSCALLACIFLGMLAVLSLTPIHSSDTCLRCQIPESIQKKEAKIDPSLGALWVAMSEIPLIFFIDAKIGLELDQKRSENMHLAYYLRLLRIRNLFMMSLIPSSQMQRCEFDREKPLISRPV